MTSKPTLDGSELVSPKRPRSEPTVGSEGGASNYGSPRHAEQHGDDGDGADNDASATRTAEHSGSAAAAEDDGDREP